MFIRVLCMKRRKKETPNPLKIEGLGELKCAKHTYLLLNDMDKQGYISFIEKIPKL